MSVVLHLHSLSHLVPTRFDGELCIATVSLAFFRRTLATRDVQLEVFIYGNEYRVAGRKAIADAKAQNPLLTVYE